VVAHGDMEKYGEVQYGQCGMRTKVCPIAKVSVDVARGVLLPLLLQMVIGLYVL